jgi:RNA polymerase sigma-70 factor (ECF subfamily)
MEEISIIVDQSAIGEESRLYSAGNKAAAIPDSSAGRYSNSNGILNHKELSDEELVRVFVETQDEEAFSEIVNRYGDKTYRLALRITHNPTDAEDVLQEVFIKLIEKLDTFHEESRFSTWLYRVTTNESYMHLRFEKKHNRDVSLEDYVSYDESGMLKGVEINDWSDRPDEVLLSKETIEMIELTMSELPEPYKIALHLRDVEGLSNVEVAKVLNLSVPNVKSRIHRARLFLRDRLSDYFYEWRK